MKIFNLCFKSTKIEFTQDLIHSNLELVYVPTDSKIDVENYHCTKTFHKVSIQSKELINLMSSQQLICLYLDSEYNVCVYSI
jgi:elongation factor P hydroxylase